MSIQLQKLAILDKASGKQFVSKDGKTRQVYQEKPITVEIEAGQKMVEGYDYQVSLSGVLSKSDKEFLTGLSSKESKVMIAGYSSTGLILQGEAKIYSDGSAFLIKSTGGISCDGEKCDICMHKNMTCNKDGFDIGTFYFPFDLNVELRFVHKSGGTLVVEQLDVKGKSLSLEIYDVPNIGRHAFKAHRVIEIEPIENRCFISIARESVHAENLSILIK
jgi:hypothetical protein